MRLDNEQINQYYTWKNDSYFKKYKNGYFIHLHTGLYDYSKHFALFNNKEFIENLEIEQIKYLLLNGQEELTYRMFNEFREDKYLNILDCGCGYCGTSIYISQNKNKIEKIVALTLSEKQVEVANALFKESSISNISPIKVDIFDYKPKRKVDGIFSIDATCHMGNYNELFKTFSRILSTNGKIVISDNFLYKDSNAKEYFDLYWKTDISNIKDLINAAISNRFTIETLINYSQHQIPFWILSQQYSKILLANEKDNNEKGRLLTSLKFHEFLSTSFANKNLQYFWIVLKK